MSDTPTPDQKLVALIRENDRLRNCVMRAFNEGYKAGKRGDGVAKAWNNSDTKKELEKKGGAA